MSELEASRTAHIRNFTDKQLNRSLTYLFCFNRLSDFMLECCNAEAKPNTLSFFSFLPLFLLQFLITGPSHLNFLLTAISLLLHQLLDIANKKQAYRLNIFTLQTYYIDHLFDSFSVVCIVRTIVVLLGFTNRGTMVIVFLFGMLPFFVHHLVMYHTGYLVFASVTPPSEGMLERYLGLVLLELLCLVCTIVPELPMMEIVGVAVWHIILLGCSIWLIWFLVVDCKALASRVETGSITANGTEDKLAKEVLVSRKSNPWSSLYIIFVLGYIMFELVAIEEELLGDNLYFAMVLGLLSLAFASIISKLLRTEAN